VCRSTTGDDQAGRGRMRLEEEGYAGKERRQIHSQGREVVAVVCSPTGHAKADSNGTLIPKNRS
jgi:exonuclease VII large subunit